MASFSAEGSSSSSGMKTSGVGSVGRLKITVFGAGSFGTALAVAAARRGHSYYVGEERGAVRCHR